MKTFLSYNQFDFRYPSKNVPDWVSQVDRWYQLDPYSYGICEAVSVWQKSEKYLPEPSILFLASPAASNEADWEFVRTGAASPAKFVHTLANVRSLALCQVMNWQGIVICLQKDPQTMVRGLLEAALHLSTQAPIIWVICVTKEDGTKSEESENGYLVHLLTLTMKNEPSFPYRVEINQFQSDQKVAIDKVFMNWIKKTQTQSDKETFDVAPGLRVVRRGTCDSN